MAEEKSPQAVETAPDPDEDDLDDLDDVLDDFAATKLDSKNPKPSASGPGRPAHAPASTSAPAVSKGPALSDDDAFAKQLQEGMADLLGELDTSPEMQRQFEELVKELGGAAVSAEPTTDPEGSAEASSSKSSAKAAEETFQDQIKRTMARMQESDSASTAAAASSNTDDILAQMLKEMEKGGFGDGTGGTDEDFSKMLMGMMEQLTNKEILYEPMKELHDKFPDWLVKNRDAVDKADLVRYEEQQRLVGEIVGKFQEKDYSDDSSSHREYIVERMQKMQAAGSPPPDLVGDMNAAQEAIGELDEGCPTQ